MKRMWQELVARVVGMLNRCSVLERENLELRERARKQEVYTFVLEEKLKELKAQRIEMMARSAAADVERCAMQGRLAVLEKERPLWRSRVPGSVQDAAERKGQYTAEERRKMARGMSGHPMVLALVDDLAVIWWEYSGVAMNPASTPRQVAGAHGAMDALQLAMFRVDSLTAPVTEAEKIAEQDRAALEQARAAR